MNSGELIKIVSSGIEYTPQKSIKQRSKYLRHRRRMRMSFIRKFGAAGIRANKAGESLRRVIKSLAKFSKIIAVSNFSINSSIIEQYLKLPQPGDGLIIISDEISNVKETREALLRLYDDRVSIHNNPFLSKRKKPPHHAKKKTFYFGRG